jgi:hypothetical protein
LREDVEALLDSFVKKDNEQLVLKDGERSTRNLADAIYSLPLLQALATNGRAAYYMVNAIAAASRRSATFLRQEWRSHLGHLVPSIVDEVVFNYIDQNGIRALSLEARRRVAAWVFGSLSRLTMKSVELPRFEGLNPTEAGKALMLLQLNVQLSNGTLTLLEHELYSASVTPALAIVLFNMAGVFTGILAGWRGEEEVAALYAALQAILDRFRTHVEDLEGKNTEIDELVKQFDESLSELYVCRLQTQVQSNKVANVNIPIVPKQSILLNAEKASFADVIAPYQLLQTKHTSIPNASVAVNLEEEMKKCCLLQDYKNDRVMRGLVALWDGFFEGFSLAWAQEDRDPPASPYDFRQLQQSKAYPANLIMTSLPFDGVEYAEILLSGEVSGTGLVLPPLPARLGVTFVLASNAKRLDLVLPGKFTLPITEASLDGTLQVVKDRLNEDQREKWTAFLGTFLEGVTLQFLFTGGVK